MKTEQITVFLDKFWDGQSSIEEEKQLKTYFSGENIAEEHKQYLGYFQLLNKERNINKHVDLKTLNQPDIVPKISTWQLIKRACLAASVMIGIIISSSLYQQRNTSLTVQNASQQEIELAYQQTTEVLAFLANKLTIANEGILEIGIIDESKSKIEKTK